MANRMSKFYIHYSENPATVLCFLQIKQPSCIIIRFESLHYSAQPVFLPSQDVACALIALIRAYYPDSPAMFFTEVQDLELCDD